MSTTREAFRKTWWIALLLCAAYAVLFFLPVLLRPMPEAARQFLSVIPFAYLLYTVFFVRWEWRDNLAQDSRWWAVLKVLGVVLILGVLGRLLAFADARSVSAPGEG